MPGAAWTRRVDSVGASAADTGGSRRGAGTRIRVVIADDHPLVRAAIRSILQEADFEVCAEAEDAPGAVEATRRERPDICLLDVRMPGDGIRAAQEITQKFPGVAVVMVTAATDIGTVFAALEAGAVGYLPKTGSLARLPETLRGVLRGEAAIPRDLTAQVLSEVGAGGRAQRHQVTGRPGVSVTSREADVLELLQRGLGTAEISERLFLSPTTVRTHVSALLRKFGVRDRAELRVLVSE
ncbi:MAG: response regulator transcription factor [Acidimicrobiia bacterium]